MTIRPVPLAMPILRTNPEGEPRRVGVELEMSGLDVDHVAALVAELFNTRIREDGRYQRILEGDPAGDWVVELDFDLLKQLGREKDVSELRRSAEDVLRWFAEPLVPVELVSPPLPLERLEEIEALIITLRQAGAKGTSDSAAYAFGLQFNPEIPSAQPAVLTAYLQAFLCLYEWLYERAKINFTRRLTHYIDPFPSEYVRIVIDPNYRPDLSRLIDDYLFHNPTRNRALDLLPLFTHLDEARVRAITTDPLIKPRPAFHYRLPDCEIDLPHWGLHIAWNDWMEVEWLATDDARRAACCAAYSEFLAQPLQRWLGGGWADETEKQWLAR